MARERSLLERFRTPEPDAQRTIHQDTRRLTESVMENLRKLLNSLHGNSPTVGEYGIPAMVDLLHDFPDAIGRMRKAVKTTIERHEPRLRRVNVRPIDSPDDAMALNFEITAELVTDDEKANVSFSTRIDGLGHVKVRG